MTRVAHLAGALLFVVVAAAAALAQARGGGEPPMTNLQVFAKDTARPWPQPPLAVLCPKDAATPA
jgi:hypothetical protein